MPTARTKNQRSRAVWNRTKAAVAATATGTTSSSSSSSSSSSTSSSQPPSSSAMPVATFQRPQPRRANTAPAATTLDADDLTKRLSMVLAQERQRQGDRERKRQSWEADLIAARREQQKRPPRSQQQQQRQPPVPAAVAVTTNSAVSMGVQQERPTMLTVADFQDQPLPSLDEDSPLETVPPRPPVPFILNSSGYVPVYAITSAIKLNNVALRRSFSADHARNLRRDSALDLETIDENHGSAADDTNNNKPTMENWRLEEHTNNPGDTNKLRKHSPAGLARPSNKERTTSGQQQQQPSEENGDGRARLRKLPTGARRPSQLGYPPEWSQVEDAPPPMEDDKAQQSPPSLTLHVRRGSERTTAPNYTWSPSASTDVMGSSSNKLERRRSIKERVESYCTIHHHHLRQYSVQSPSTSSSSDSGRDDVHSSYSSRSWRSSLKGSLSGSRRSSILKFWWAADNKQQQQQQQQASLSAGEKEVAARGSRDIIILTDSEDSSSMMTPRAQKRSSLLSVFHL